MLYFEKAKVQKNRRNFVLKGDKKVVIIKILKVFVKTIKIFYELFGYFKNNAFICGDCLRKSWFRCIITKLFI